MVQRIRGAIIRLHYRHLEPTGDRFLEDRVGEGWPKTKAKGFFILSTAHLNLAQLVLDLADLLFDILSMVESLLRLRGVTLR